MDKIVKALFFFILAATLASCKKISKNILTETTEEISEKSGNKFFKKTERSAIRELSEHIVKKDGKAAIEALCESNHLFNTLWKKQTGSTQQLVIETIEKQPRILNYLSEDPSTIDRFISHCSHKTLKLPSLFAYFVECNHKSRSKCGYSLLSKLDFVDAGDGFVNFVRKSDQKVIGKLEDGFVHLKLPHATQNIFNHDLLKETLIPGVTYKITDQSGKLKYTIKTNQVGKISEIQGRELDRFQISSNILHIGNQNINLPINIKTGKNEDWDATVKIFYNAKDEIPQTAKVELKKGGKTEVSELVCNTTKITPIDLSDIAKVAKKQGLSQDKITKLLRELENKPELATLIRENPENIKRWLNTRNHVNKSLVAKTEKGRFVPNGRNYAGNTYYLNPNLNDGLAARLRDPARGGEGFVQLKSGKKLSYEDLVELDRKFPNGIPFSKEGFPDFSKVAYKKNSQPVELDLTHFDPNLGRQADINKANKIFRAKYGHEVPKGYTWHHIENSRKLVLVPTDFHQLVDHAGGIAAKNK